MAFLSVRPEGAVDTAFKALGQPNAEWKGDGGGNGEKGKGHVGGSSRLKERCVLPDPKVDRPGNLSTVVVDKILTKSKNCGAKSAVIPNITSRAEGVTCSSSTTAFTETGAQRPVAALGRCLYNLARFALTPTWAAHACSRCTARCSASTVATTCGIAALSDGVFQNGLPR
ncbi:TPA: hypothetical protein ACKP5X_000437 [Stenotrophomonas maltophilia]